jgi:hypothetical protein
MKNILQYIRPNSKNNNTQSKADILNNKTNQAGNQLTSGVQTIG